MTANATVEDRERSLSAGMNAHLNKPIDPKELYSALLSWIEPGEREVPAGLGEAEDEQDADKETLSIAGLDTQAGIERIGGNQASYRKLLGKFVDNQAGAIDEIINALTGGDSDAAVRAAHTLKGVSGSIGAAELQRLGADLEKTLQESPQSNVDALLAAAREELQRVTDAIMAALGSRERPEQTSGEALPANYRERLQALSSQLAEYDSEASDTLDQLIDEVGDPSVRTELKKIANLVGQYDYDRAQALLSDLIA